MSTIARDDWQQDTEESLCAMYEAWMQQESLQLGCAEEALHDEELRLTESQWAWLVEFCERWDACMKRATRMAEEAREANLRG